MKHFYITSVAILIGFNAFAQSRHDKATYSDYQPGYWENVIKKGIDSAKTASTPKEPVRKFKFDLEGVEVPGDPALFTQSWHNTPVSQGNTGTCWCFSTTSFYESEVYRITGKKVKLSEMYPVYWQYVERAKYFVAHRGKMEFGEGSETNAVAEMYSKYGIVPMDAFNGLKDGKIHDHSMMTAELSSYLKSVKERNDWNEEEVIATTKSILNFYLGAPPQELKVAGKTLSPKQYLTDYLRIKPEDYRNFMSLMQSPWWEKAEYKVADNWWHSTDYFNIPSTDFISAVKAAVKSGYTISIGGDVSEPGIVSGKNVMMVPSFDIPSEYIDDAARQLRFNNGSTTDDHAMHMVGFKEGSDGKTWFLIKDSGAGARNCGESCKSFGYWYMSEDYVKLKLTTLTVHKDAVKEVVKKMKS